MRSRMPVQAIPYLALVVASLVTGGSGLLGATTLNFPRLGFEVNTFTGIAFVNPTGSEATLTLTAYDAKGTEIQQTGFDNPRRDLTVPPRRQVALTTAEIFNGSLPPEDFGWMQVTSSTDGITGFFLYLDGSITQFDGADLPASGRKLVFPRIRQGEGFSTEINLVNPGTVASDLELELFVGGEGTAKVSAAGVSLPPKGLLRVDLKQHFGIDTAPDGTFLLATGTSPIAGFELVRSQSEDLIGLNAAPTVDGLDILYFPQLAVLGDWATNLGVVNLSDQPVIATVSAMEASGSLYQGAALQGANPAVIPIPANSAVYRDAAELFGFSGDTTIDGWLKVESSGPPLTGFVSYGVPAFGSAAAVAVQPQAINRARFSHLATASYFTGIALLNPGQIANPYRIMAFDKTTGASLGVYDGVLQPGERISRLVDDLIKGAAGRDGGFIWVKTEQPAYMTSLFGTPPPRQRLVLANIPAQPAAAGYNPDLSLPAIRVNPPIAVIQPGKSQQFVAIGSQGTVQDSVEWAVNGTPSGNDQVGLIDTRGVYTAPGTNPAALPVTISARVEAAAGGASVDVLGKDVLFEGNGVVQSLTYLRSLKLLYSAELLGSGTAGRSAPQAGETTEIWSNASAGARTQVRSLPNRNIVKMIDFTGADGLEYLLFCDKALGEVLRFNPRQPGTAPVVIQGGFDQPNSIAFDPVTRNLLVADRTQIWSVERSTVETGLSGAGASMASSAPARPVDRLVSGLNDARGVSVDACTGNIYVTEGSGRLLAIDRITGQRQVVLELGSAGQILGLYRKEVPCPASFQVLVADQESDQILLYLLSQEYTLPWLVDVPVREIAYLPIDNEFTGDSGILIGEADSFGSRATLVPVPGLYVNRQKNVGLAQYGAEYADPVGDVFNPGQDQVDLTLAAALAGEGPGSFYLHLRFDSPVFPVDLTGYIDLDVDRDPATGATSYIDLASPFSSNLGVEYRLNLAAYEPYGTSGFEGVVPIVDARTGQFVANALVFSQPPPTSELSIEVPLGILDATVPINFGVIVGPGDRFTDVAPNGGYLVPAVP